MANNNNEHRVAINFYAEVTVSDELWNELQKEDNDKAIHEITNKYGFVLMDDEETVPEGTPLISRISDFDTCEEFYIA